MRRRFLQLVSYEKAGTLHNFLFGFKDLSNFIARMSHTIYCFRCVSETTLLSPCSSNRPIAWAANFQKWQLAIDRPAVCWQAVLPPDSCSHQERS